jgi:hypothetical protein
MEQKTIQPIELLTKQCSASMVDAKQVEPC